MAEHFCPATSLILQSQRGDIAEKWVFTKMSFTLEMILVNFDCMKTTLTIETNSRSQIETLLQFLTAMGIGVSLLQSEEDLDWKKLGMLEMEKEWSGPENEHWDEFLKKAQKK